MNAQQIRQIAIWGLIVALFLVMINMSSNNVNRGQDVQEFTYTEFMNSAESGNISTANIDESASTVTGQTTSGEAYSAVVPVFAPDMAETLRENNVRLEYQERARPNPWISGLMGLLPILFLIAIAVFMFRNMQGQGRGGAMSFGKSRAKLLTENTKRVTFEDVAGVEPAKDDLREIVQYLEDPTKFTRLGAKIPTGALLIGPPGTGKTLLARAVAGEAGVPFFTISGSDFVEMFVGVGASRVRDMFAEARKNAPCIIFIDEIDAVGRHRGVGTSGGHEEREQTLNQLLVEMDGFEGGEGIIIIAATNRPDVLDKALLRPGRFDRQVEVPLPDINGREKILGVHMRGKPIGQDVDAKYVARGTPGFSGADLANLVNEAALLAARRNKRKVTMREFEDARDKVMMGAERKTLAMSQEEKEMTAYHEAGHAIVGLNMPGSLPIHKATIIPRGRALGMVQYLPERDQISQSKEEMIAYMAMAMGGRVAEELKYGEMKVTSGAASDIEQCTRIATAMVTEYGLSDEIGPIAYKHTDNNSFVPGIGRGSAISPETARKIEDEIQGLVKGAHAKATSILTEKREDWEALSQALLEYETISGDEIKNLLEDGIKPKRATGKERLSVSPIPSTKGIGGAETA